MVPPSALGMVVALAMVTTAAGQNSCADYRRDHAAIFLSCQSAIPNIEENFRSPTPTVVAAVCNTSCVQPTNTALVRQMINRGCMANYSQLTSAELNEMLLATVEFMCVESGTGQTCMNTLPLGCAATNGTKAERCPTITAAWASMGCCAGDFAATAHSFHDAGLVSTCIGNNLSSIRDVLQLCNISNEDPCARTTTPAPAQSGGVKARLGEDFEVAVGVLFVIAVVAGGAVIFFLRRKREQQDEEFDDYNNMLISDTNDVYGPNDDD
eukprot:m.415504 g.415504  ORF g.415504 m.415504 type:complete len:268 (-) comp29652_c0_seq1:44-847(-)